MWETGRSASDIVEDKGLKQISDAGAIAAIVDQLIADNPEQAILYPGNEKIIGWFVGQVMKATQGKANPGVVNQLLRESISDCRGRALPVQGQPAGRLVQLRLRHSGLHAGLLRQAGQRGRRCHETHSGRVLVASIRLLEF
jgi:hypothetical protein